MGVIDDILSILLNSKKANELPVATEVTSNDYIIFWNSANNRTEIALRNNFAASNQTFGALYLGFVPTAGASTTTQEIEDFINAQGFSVAENEMKYLQVTSYVETLLYREIYAFKSNIVGNYGTAAANPIDYFDDLVRLSRLPFDTRTDTTQIIDLGDIGASTIEDYINALNPTFYALDVDKLYEFKCVINGSQIEYFWIGALPSVIGFGGTPVTAADFYELLPMSFQSNGLNGINEGNGIGFVRFNSDPADRGVIGFNAFDFSYNNAANDPTMGALGTLAVNFGEENKNPAYGGFTQGYLNTTSSGGNGAYSTIFGYSNQALASSYLAFITGIGNIVQNNYGVAQGVYNIIKQFYGQAYGIDLITTAVGQVAVGIGNVEDSITGINTATAKAFVVGIGTLNIGSPNRVDVRKNGFYVTFDGLAYLPNADIGAITAAANTVIPTKEWVLANIGGITKYVETIGNDVDTVFTINHNLNDTDVLVQLRYIVSGEFLDTVGKVVDANNVELEFFSAPLSTNQIRVVIKK